MNAYDGVLEAVAGLIRQLAPQEKLVIGALPPEDALCIAWGSSSYSPFLSKTHAAVEMTAVFNGKHTDQQALSGTMGRIHTALSTRKEYPAGENYQITNIQTVSAPALLSREENDRILYGSSLSVKFYLKEEE